MPRFHETGYGRRFFERQLPYLINEIKNTSDALKEVAEGLKEKQNEPEKVIFQITTKDILSLLNDIENTDIVEDEEKFKKLLSYIADIYETSWEENIKNIILSKKAINN